MSLHKKMFPWISCIPNYDNSCTPPEKPLSKISLIPDFTNVNGKELSLLIWILMILVKEYANQKT